MEKRKRVRRGDLQVKEPGTKLYTPHVDDTAYAYDPETGEKRSQPTFTSAPIKSKQRAQLKPSAVATLVVCAFIFSAMLLFTLSGYEKISRAYSAIDDLEDSIDDIKIRINALEAEIECAVTIEEATAYATAHGMQYPLRSQYKHIGDSTVAGTAALSGTTSAEGPSGTFTDESGTSGETAGDDTVPGLEIAEDEQ